MTFPSLFRRPSTGMSLTLSAALLSGSCLLLWMHATAVRDMRETGLPAALALPQIEKRMEILREQNDIAQLQASLRGGSAEDQFHAYVIPPEDDTDRVLAMFDVFFSYLEQTKQLVSFSDITIGDTKEVSEGLKAFPLSFTARLTPEGLSKLFLFTDLSGLMTVSDALTKEDIQTMLTLTEEENPASVAALEHFLSTDLLRYSEEPKPYEEQLRKSFSQAAEPMLRTFFDAARLQRAQQFYQEFAPVLRQQNLWPLRLLTIEEASQKDAGKGLVDVSLTLKAYVDPK